MYPIGIEPDLGSRRVAIHGLNPVELGQEGEDTSREWEEL